jgi:hypothetical protein
MRYFLLDINKGFSPFSSTSQNKKTPQWNDVSTMQMLSGTRKGCPYADRARPVPTNYRLSYNLITFTSSLPLLLPQLSIFD